MVSQHVYTVFKYRVKTLNKKIKKRPKVANLEFLIVEKSFFSEIICRTFYYSMTSSRVQVIIKEDRNKYQRRILRRYFKLAATKGEIIMPEPVSNEISNKNYLRKLKGKTVK